MAGQKVDHGFGQQPGLLIGHGLDAHVKRRMIVSDLDTRRTG